jgi:cysteinyl-tRNA synthetase
MSAKKEKKIKSEKNTPAKAKLEIPDFIAYQQVNIGSEKIDAANVQQLLSERAQCKLRKDFDRADAIARSLQSMNVRF